jgi:hypothetical protein
MMDARAPNEDLEYNRLQIRGRILAANLADAITNREWERVDWIRDQIDANEKRMGKLKLPLTIVPHLL